MQETVLYGELLKNWLGEQQGCIKESTYRSYKNLIENHILPVLGDCPANALSKEKILEAADIWLCGGRKNGRGGLSEKTVWESVNLIRRSLAGEFTAFDISFRDIKNLAAPNKEPSVLKPAPLYGSGMLYKDWLKIWLGNKKSYVKETTFSDYTIELAKRIIPALGSCTLAELDEEKLQQTALYWLTSGRKDGSGGLSERTVREDIMIIKLSLKAASKEGLIPRRQMDIRFPAQKRDLKPTVLSPENQSLYVKTVLKNLNSRTAGIIFCLHTGVRIGELCALQWNDIDLTENTVYIHKTLERVSEKDLDGNGGTKIVISAPKTQSSIRTVPISPSLKELLSLIYNKNPKAYFLTGSEQFTEPDNYRKYYSSFLKKHKLPHIKFHGLRHTFATRLIENGVDCKTVSELLGHASVNMTMNLYVHPQMDQKRRAVELLDKL